MVKFVFGFILGFSFSVQVLAVPVEGLLSPDRLRQLQSLEQGRIIETQTRNPSPVLLPQNSELQQFVGEIRRALNPNMMVEALYLHSKPGSFRTSVDSWDVGQKTGVFNQLVAISSLTGVQYFSASRNTMRTFYEFSRVIDAPQTRNPLPDPVFSQLPNTLTLFARQRDLTFGDNIYRYDYRVTPDVIFFVQENVTGLSYYIPVIGRGNLRSVLAVIDCGDSILVYAISMARAASPPGLGDRINSSFTNRAEALLNWLAGRFVNELFN
ncbi:MAG: hypothetical protein LBC80_04455 [Treponema sp.]|nr:hypothetical protein [Treponema sp.]